MIPIFIGEYSLNHNYQIRSFGITKIDMTTNQYSCIEFGNYPINLDELSLVEDEFVNQDDLPILNTDTDNLTYETIENYEFIKSDAYIIYRAHQPCLSTSLNTLFESALGEYTTINSFPIN